MIALLTENIAFSLRHKNYDRANEVRDFTYSATTGEGNWQAEQGRNGALGMRHDPAAGESPISRHPGHNGTRFPTDGYPSFPSRGRSCGG